jgi:hypothetical protein
VKTVRNHRELKLNFFLQNSEYGEIFIFFCCLVYPFTADFADFEWKKMTLLLLSSFRLSLWCTHIAVVLEGLGEAVWENTCSALHGYLNGGGGGGRPYQRKDIYIEHRAGKAPRLASWRKMTQQGEFCC